MSLVNLTIRGYFSIRNERMIALYENQLQTQENWLKYILKHGEKTLFAQHFGLENNMTYDQFVAHLPVQEYTSLLPYIQKVMQGEKNILWSSKISWMAKSSGTTSAKSKFIPVSDESLKLNNYLSSQDVLTFYCYLFPETELFGGKGITLGGSFQSIEGSSSSVRCGDISAILMENMPFIGEFLKAPAKDILLQSDWNKKLPLIAENTINENITSISGVPSWMLLVLKELLALANKEYIHEVWPNIELYMHGGVAFDPYIEEYKKLFSKGDIFFMNMYNASEGFFGFQDQKECDDLLLLTDHAVFYEFIEITDSDVNTMNAIPLHEVELGKKYAIVITTVSGLWRYQIGDTIRFTSLSPYRFKLVGRTTHYINVFGEELIVDNA
ncbi:MAG: GH3 auxin-responsive promoter family protein, partial [Bacteroidales bacterium]|nr:GH3 auxin-responsive promoter family protein [Bacteroidales bacterium]